MLTFGFRVIKPLLLKYKISIFFNKILVSPVEYQALLLIWGFLLFHIPPYRISAPLETFHPWVSHDGVSLIIYILKKESEIVFKKPK